MSRVVSEDRKFDEEILRGIDSNIARILTAALSDKEVSQIDAISLFETTGEELLALRATANEIRRRKVGDLVTFVIVRNINFTNICYTGCGFCGFAKRKEAAEAEFLSLDELARRASEAAEHGATEVCIQGGLHPNIEWTHYRDIIVAIKEKEPEIHIHAFSPFEIKYGAELMGKTPKDFLTVLKENGLGTIPGTAAEILDTEIRRKLTKDKLTAEEWVEIIKTAHGLGIRSTATIMYGHIDEPKHWAAHIDLIRNIQKETGGFTEFVPLGFIHREAPMYVPGKMRPGPTLDENIKMHAVSRLMLNGWIDNIQVSWVKLGPDNCKKILCGGANDFGGTLMNETISTSSGAQYGQEITPTEMVEMIRDIGRIPAQRNTLYDIVETFEDHNPPNIGPLVSRKKEKVNIQ